MQLADLSTNTCAVSARGQPAASIAFLQQKTGKKHGSVATTGSTSATGEAQKKSVNAGTYSLTAGTGQSLNWLALALAYKP